MTMFVGNVTTKFDADISSLVKALDKAKTKLQEVSKSKIKISADVAGADKLSKTVQSIDKSLKNVSNGLDAIRRTARTVVAAGGDSISQLTGKADNAFKKASKQIKKTSGVVDEEGQKSQQTIGGFIDAVLSGLGVISLASMGLVQDIHKTHVNFAEFTTNTIWLSEEALKEAEKARKAASKATKVAAAGAKESKDVFQEVWDFLDKGFTDFGEWLEDAVDDAGKWLEIQLGWREAAKQAAEVGERVIPIAQQAERVFINMGGWAKNAITDLSWFFKALNEGFINATTDMTEWFYGAEALTAWAKAQRKWFSELRLEIVQFGKDTMVAFQGIGLWVREAIETVQRFGVTFFENVGNILGSVLGLNDALKGVTTQFGRWLAVSAGLSQLSLAFFGLNAVVKGFFGFFGKFAAARPDTMLGKIAELISTIYVGVMDLISPMQIIANKIFATIALTSTAVTLVGSIAGGVNIVSASMFGIVGMVAGLQPLIRNMFQMAYVKMAQVAAYFGVGKAQFILLLAGLRESFFIVQRFVKQLGQLPNAFNIVGAIKTAFDLLKGIYNVAVSILSVLAKGTADVVAMATNIGNVADKTFQVEESAKRTGRAMASVRYYYEDLDNIGQRVYLSIAELMQKIPLVMTTIFKATFRTFTRVTKDVFGAINERTFAPLLRVTGRFIKGSWASLTKKIWSVFDRGEGTRSKSGIVAFFKRSRRIAQDFYAKVSSADKETYEKRKAQIWGSVRAQKELNKVRMMEEKSDKATGKTALREVEKKVEVAEKEQAATQKSLEAARERIKLEKAAVDAVKQSRAAAYKESIKANEALLKEKKTLRELIDEGKEHAKQSHGRRISIGLKSMTAAQDAQKALNESEEGKKLVENLRKSKIKLGPSVDSAQALKVLKTMLHREKVLREKTERGIADTKERTEKRTLDRRMAIMRRVAGEQIKILEQNQRAKERINREEVVVAGKIRKQQVNVEKRIRDVQEKNAAISRRRAELEAAKQTLAIAAETRRKQEELLRRSQENLTKLYEQRTKAREKTQRGSIRAVERVRNIEIAKSYRKVQATIGAAEGKIFLDTKDREKMKAAIRKDEARKVAEDTMKVEVATQNKRIFNDRKMVEELKKNSKSLSETRKTHVAGEIDHEKAGLKALANLRKGQALKHFGSTGGGSASKAGTVSQRQNEMLGKGDLFGLLGERSGRIKDLQEAHKGLEQFRREIKRTEKQLKKSGNNKFATSLRAYLKAIESISAEAPKLRSNLAGIATQAGAPAAAIDTLSKKGKSSFAALLQNFVAMETKLKGSFTEGVFKKHLEKIFDKEMVDSLVKKNAITPMYKGMVEAGKQMKSGLISQKQALESTMSKTMDGVRDYIPQSPPKKGPLKGNVLPKAGAMITTMVSKGIMSKRQEAAKSMDKVLQESIRDRLPSSPPKRGAIAGNILSTAGGKIISMVSFGMLKEGGMLGQTFNRLLAPILLPLKPAGMFFDAMTGAISQIFSMADAFGNLVNSGPVRELRDVAKSVREIGMAAERFGMAVPEYDKFAKASELLGVESSQLETVFTQLSRSMEDARSGSKEARRDLFNMGIDMQALDNDTLSLTDVFLKMSDSYEELGGQGQLANKILQTSGATFRELRYLMSQGGDEIRDAMDKVDMNNLAMTDEMVDNSKEFLEKTKLIEQTIAKVKKALLSELMPYLSRWFNTLSAFWAAYSGHVFATLTMISKVAGAVFDDIYNRIKGYFEGTRDLGEDVREIFHALFNLAMEIARIFVERVLDFARIVFDRVSNILAPIFTFLFNKVKDYFAPRALAELVLFISKFTNQFTASFLYIWNWAAGIVSRIGAEIYHWFETAWIDIKWYFNLAARALVRVISLPLQTLFNYAISSINGIVSALNSIPGVDIGTISEMDFSDRLDSTYANAEASLLREKQEAERNMQTWRENQARSLTSDSNSAEAYEERAADAIQSYYDAVMRETEAGAGQANFVMRARMRDMVNGAIAEISALAEEAGAELAEASQELAPAFQQLFEALVTADGRENINAAISEWRTKMEELGVPAIRIEELLEDVQERAEEVGVAIREAMPPEFFEDINNVMRGVEGEFTDLRELLLSQHEELYGEKAMKRERQAAEMAEKRRDIEQKYYDLSDKLVERRKELNELAEAAKLRAGEQSEAYQVIMAQLEYINEEEARLLSTRNEALDNLDRIAAKKKIEEWSKPLGETVGSGLGEAIGQGMKDMLSGKKAIFREVVNNAFSSIRDSMLDNFVKDMTESLTTGLTKAFESAFSFAGEAAGALASGVVAMIATAIASATQEVESTKAEIRDMVESTETVRGVISGQTDVKLQAVAKQLRDALIPTNQILEGIRLDLRGVGVSEATVGNTSA